MPPKRNNKRVHSLVTSSRTTRSSKRAKQEKDTNEAAIVPTKVVYAPTEDQFKGIDRYLRRCKLIESWESINNQELWNHFRKVVEADPRNEPGPCVLIDTRDKRPRAYWDASEITLTYLNEKQEENKRYNDICDSDLKFMLKWALSKKKPIRFKVRLWMGVSPVIARDDWSFEHYVDVCCKIVGDVLSNDATLVPVIPDIQYNDDNKDGAKNGFNKDGIYTGFFMKDSKLHCKWLSDEHCLIPSAQLTTDVSGNVGGAVHLEPDLYTDDEDASVVNSDAPFITVSYYAFSLRERFIQRQFINSLFPTTTGLLKDLIRVVKGYYGLGYGNPEPAPVIDEDDADQ